MIERFQGTDGKRRLISALTEQRIIQGNEKLATEIAEKVVLKEIESGAELISQDGEDSDLYFIVSGKFSVVINQRDVAVRGPGLHVGEMALIDPTAKRTASVSALEKGVVASISEPCFSEFAQKEPKLWRQIALELSDRLKERSKFIREPNIQPVVFLGSASEQIEVARKIQEGLKSESSTIKLWTEGVFEASATAIESLMQVVQNYDFGIIIFGHDDVVSSRGTSVHAPRDNVIFELGLLMGGVGRERTFILRPRGLDIKIPSDLFGITCLEYDLEDAGSLSKTCDYLRGKITSMGSK